MKKTQQSNRTYDPVQLVIQGYQNDRVVSRYKTVRLWKSEQQLVEQYFPKEGTILDLGCGAGRTTIAMHKLGYKKLLGLDIAPMMIHAAKEQANINHANINFQVADVVQTDLPTNHFDGVLFAYNGIEHIPGIKQKRYALKKIHSWMKPGAYFIFTFHSGLPFNDLGGKLIKRWIMYITKKLFRLPSLEKEWGERFFIAGVKENQYCHIIPQFYWEKILSENQFDIIYHNSQQNIETGRQPNFFSQFHQGNLFMVAQKAIDR